MFKRILILTICIFAFSANAMEKKTTFDQELFNKAQSEGKVIVISSWIEYCSSCAKQMKILKTAKKEGELSDIKFDNICLLYTSPSPRDTERSRMPSSA